MQKYKILPLMASISLCLSAQAQNQSTQEQEVYQQESMVITASRYQQAQDDIIPSISVIDREDILNLQANSILDILVQQQGIDVARNGGNGTATSVFMRGTNSNHVLVLIDGVRVGSSFTGSFTWEHLPISQVERIEIVRGSRVSYYGSDAIGGVINIITRKQDNLYARYTTGSFNTHNFDVGYGNSTENFRYSMVIGSQKTDGFSATNENNAFGFNPDDDGYNNLSLNLSGSYQLENGAVSVNFLKTKADVDFDSVFDRGNSEITEDIAKISWQAKLFNDWNSEVSLANNKNTLDTLIYMNDFKSNRYTLDWLLNKSFDNNHLGFGLSYRDEKAEFNSRLLTYLSIKETRKNKAAFVNWQGTYANNIFSTSIRLDDNNTYGTNTTGDLSWAYQFNDDIRFNVSAGTAFHAPGLNDFYSIPAQVLVYSPELDQFVFIFGYEGNSDLKPEESKNYEIGLKANFTDNQKISANLFYYDIDNLLDYQGSTFQPFNVNSSTIKGLEIAYDFAYNDLRLNINATLQDANNNETDTPLLRRPDHKLNINIDKSFGKFSLGSSIRYASKNPGFGINLDSYTVIDIRAAYEFNPHWKISAKFENVTDKEYQVINGYNTADASAYLTIQWQQ